MESCFQTSAPRIQARISTCITGLILPLSRKASVASTAARPRVFSSRGPRAGNRPPAARNDEFLAPLDLSEQFGQMRLRFGDFHDRSQLSLPASISKVAPQSSS
jgi:hypothetical protein